VIVPLALALAAATVAAPEAPLSRLALVIARNDGGADRPELRFAHADAQTFAGVLRELGGVPADAVTTILEPDRAGLLQGLDDLRARAQSRDGRTEVIFYYSGHSDADGLILGAERLPYRDLKERIAAIPAAVRVVVLDSCSSGAFTRLKGGIMRAPLQVDASVDVKGTAVLTSSSVDETAQESDRLRGSFFTHALVTGLRGAADSSGDGRVTLTEAYHYSFTDTLQRTERTSGGAQHAAFDIRLSGTGDLVLTDVRHAPASLVLAPVLAGRVFVRTATGSLVAELLKDAGLPMALAVAEGTYDVTLQVGGATRSARVTTRGATTLVEERAFSDVPVEQTRGRGAAVMHDGGLPQTAMIYAGSGTLAIGSLALLGLGATSLGLHLEASRADGSADAKQVALDWGPWLLGGTALGTGLAVAGGVALAFSLSDTLSVESIE
jgi:hypothetical protein